MVAITATIPQPFEQPAIAISTGGVSDAADFIAQRLRTELLNRMKKETQTFGAGFSQAESDIAAIEEECCVTGWDGYGALPANPESMAYARRFLDELPIGMPAPTVSIEPDGEICFEWYKNQRYILSISFSAHGEINYAYLMGTQKQHGSGPISEISSNIYTSIRKISKVS